MRRWGLYVKNMYTTAQLRLRVMTPESPLKVIDIAWAHFIRHPFSLYNDGIISASSKTICGKANRQQTKIYLRFNLTVFFFFKSEVDYCTKLWQNDNNQTVLSSPYIACIKGLFQMLSQRFFADSVKGINSDRSISYWVITQENFAMIRTSIGLNSDGKLSAVFRR